MWVKTWEMTTNKRMLRLLPELIWTGMSIGIFASKLAVMVNDCIKDDPKKTPDENDSY